MNLNDKVTIVIPCKNEKGIIQKTLDLLNYQSDIWGAKGLTKEKGHDVAVWGHIHQPKLEIDYMNSGDFCENSTCLVEDKKGEWKILNI